MERRKIGFARPTSSGGISSSPSLQTAYDPLQSPRYVEPDTPGVRLNVPMYTSGSTSDAGSSKEKYGTASSGEAKDAGEKREQVSHPHLPRAVQRGMDPGRGGRWSRPFRWGVDLPRGILQSLQTLIHYLLM